MRIAANLAFAVVATASNVDTEFSAEVPEISTANDASLEFGIRVLPPSWSISLPPVSPEPPRGALLRKCDSFDGAKTVLSHAFNKQSLLKDVSVSLQPFIDCPAAKGFDDLGCYSDGSADVLRRAAAGMQLCSTKEYPEAPKLSKGKCQLQQCLDNKKLDKKAVFQHNGKTPEAFAETILLGRPILARFNGFGVYHKLWKTYLQGDLTDVFCRRSVDLFAAPETHWLAIVGYRRKNNKIYFKVRMPFGPSYGEDGHAYMELGACGWSEDPEDNLFIHNAARLGDALAFVDGETEEAAELLSFELSAEAAERT